MSHAAIGSALVVRHVPSGRDDPDNTGALEASWLWAVDCFPRHLPDAIIGYGGVRWRDFSGVEKLNLGYRFAPPAWGKGLATELAMEAIRFSFSELGADEVWALVRPTNTESIRVLLRSGMCQVGTEDDVPGELPSLLFRILGPRSNDDDPGEA